MAKRIGIYNILALLISSAGALAANAAYAQSTDCQKCQSGNQTNDLDQNQAGNVGAAIVIKGEAVTIDVPNSDGSTSPVSITASDVSSTSSAAGNAISASADSGVSLDYKSGQTLSGNVSATNDVTTLSAVPGTVYVVTAANGNAAQAATNSGDLSYVATQDVAATSAISANAAVQTAPDMGYLYTNTQASANNAAIDKNYGLINFTANQNNNGSVNANTNIDTCCNMYSMSSNSIATGNTTSSISVNSTSYNYITQGNYGNIVANNKQNITTDNIDTSLTAQAAGNSAFNYNQYGYTQMNSAQYSNGNIAANARLDSAYFDGTVIVGSAAQGNSTVMSAIGTSGAVYSNQQTGSDGTILATTNFDSYTQYGVGYGTASASGNALASFICAGCSTDSVSMNSATYQENNAAETAIVNMSASGNGRLHAYGVAAGNSATFITQNGQNY